MTQTLDQQRAAHAWQLTQKLKEDQEKEVFHDEYASYVTQLPVTILSNGLGQAAAMLLRSAGRKQDKPHKLLYEHLQEWLCRKDVFAPYSGQASLMEAIVKGSREDYVKAQLEALAWLEWLKKFAVAFLKKGGA